MLLQIAKLVSLLESPIFTCFKYYLDLRLQLLENDGKFYLRKCYFGLMMILPQGKAFEALRNRVKNLKIFEEKCMKKIEEKKIDENKYLIINKI